VVRDAHAAEDIFQNMALKAITRNVSFKKESDLLSWAFITARREGIDWLRRHRRELIGLEPDILSLLEREWLTEPESTADSRMEALQECLEELPEKPRNLLKMRYSDGYTCVEMADRIGTGLDAIYKRMSRLHQSLKHCIEMRLGESGGSRP
jgi:RNA polymerase sigma-70 factor (ECF subfamily)